MKQRLIPLLIAASVATPAVAMDEAQILQRLEQLEAQRQADQQKIEALQREVRALKSSASSTVLKSGEAQQLQQQIVKVEKKGERRVASLKRKLEAGDKKLKINGYMSAYAVKSTLEGVDLGIGVDNHWSYRPDSIVGLQFEYAMSEGLDAVVQLTAKGGDDFDINAEWAFLRYKPNDNLTLRAGRLRRPYYMYSDSLEVGYAYPWVRPPVEVYIPSLTTYEGFDAEYAFNWGDWRTAVQVYHGRGSGLNSILTNDGLSGVNATIERGSWTFRGSYNHGSEVRWSDSPELGQDDVAYYSVGARYDDGSLFALVEAVDSEVEEDLAVVGSVGITTTLGYQIGNAVPYFVYAKGYSDKGQEDNALSPGAEVSQESYTLGLRYQLNPQVAVKAEAAQYDDFNGSLGKPSLSADPTVRQELDEDGVTIMSVGFDAVF